MREYEGCSMNRKPPAIGSYVLIYGKYEKVTRIFEKKNKDYPHSLVEYGNHGKTFRICDYIPSKNMVNTYGKDEPDTRRLISP